MRTRRHRTRTDGPKFRLPLGTMRGRFLITEGAIAAAERLLPSFRGPDGDHEGQVFLLGRELDELTILTTALAPDADHGRGHVFSDESQVATAARVARQAGLAILGQLHTHGRDYTEHSCGDDTLVLMPFEGMLSLIAPWYGRFGLRPLWSLGVHQYQDDGWALLTSESVREGFHIVASGIDLR